MTSNLSTVAYIGATILFILSLGGLSNQETARRGNLYGMVGMTLAIFGHCFRPSSHSSRHTLDCGQFGGWRCHWLVRCTLCANDTNA